MYDPTGFPMPWKSQQMKLKPTFKWEGNLQLLIEIQEIYIKQLDFFSKVNNKYGMYFTFISI